MKVDFEPYCDGCVFIEPIAEFDSHMVIDNRPIWKNTITCSNIERCRTEFGRLLTADKE